LASGPKKPKSYQDRYGSPGGDALRQRIEINVDASFIREPGLASWRAVIKDHEGQTISSAWDVNRTAQKLVMKIQNLASLHPV
jgi:hypothetical protein